MSETAAVPAVPAAMPTRHLELGFPNFVKFVAFMIGFVGVLAGLSMFAGIGFGTPFLGTCILVGAAWSAISIYAFGDIVLSLRKITFNTEK